MEQIYELRTKISKANPRYTAELRKMLKVCEDIATELSRESINCKRHGRETANYVALKQQFDESVEVVEHHIVLATLLG
jgi:hypothetical protein